MHQRMIAEGVSTAKQLASQQAFYCEISQGSLLGQPPAAGTFAFLLGSKLSQQPIN